MRTPANILASTGEAIQRAGDSHRRNPPWWAWVVISIGLAELGWLGKNIIYTGNRTSAMETQIQDIRQADAQRAQQQSAQDTQLSSSITTLDADVQTLSVNVAVLTQKVSDEIDKEGRR